MRMLLMLGGLAILLATHLGCETPPQERRAKKVDGFRKVDFDPLSYTTTSQRCQANERTSVIVYGQGTSPLGVYVYDAHGNCVARDDLSLGRVTDDLAAAWQAPREEFYDIEIYNFGRKPNTAELAIR